VSAADRRSVGELVADCDLLARQSLFDLISAEAPAMVRAWPGLAQAAASLFSVLPPEGNGWPGDDPMVRIAEVGAAVGRSVAAGHWPGSGPAAEIFDEVTTNLTRAATMINRPPDGTGDVADQPAGGGLQMVRTQLMHAVYVTAHSVATALAGYQHDLERGLSLATARRERHAERPNALEIEGAAGMRARFDVIEQLASGYVAAHQPSNRQPISTYDRDRSTTTRLEAALAVWDVQAHRTLARRPDPADLVRVARVQALIATTTGVITQAAARRGELDPGVLERLAPALEAAQLGWARTARRWGELTNPASRTDRALTDAAAELRAVIAAATANQTGWASPDQIAERIDLPVAMQALHLGMAAGLDLAYVNRDVAAHHPGLAAPARVIALRAQGEAEIAAEQGDTRYEGLTWATPKQFATNQLIPLPEPARRGMIDSTDDVIIAATHAVAVAAELNARDRPRLDRARSPLREPRSHPLDAGSLRYPNTPSP
jgi:hypothetical protein